MKNLKLMPLLLGLVLILSSCGKDSMMTDNSSSSSLAPVIGEAGGGNEFDELSSLPKSHIGTAHSTTIINSNRTFYSDSVYVLHGYVFVGDGTSSSNPTLTIQPGTIVRGEVDEASTLIINRYAQIDAQGTASNPIVFTSNDPANSSLSTQDCINNGGVDCRNPGDWGGVVILGDATTNQSEPLVIEGIPSNITDGNSLARFGGSDDSDNSGTLKYARIEYAGTEQAPGDETNGLTLGAVGSGTTLEHIQVSYGLDDGYEFFGGTVNAKYLIAYRNDDDSFDTDFGYRGNIQFAVDYRDPELVNSSGSNAFEANSDDESDDGTPDGYDSRPIFSNVTLIGPARPGGTPDIDPEYEAGLKLREGTALNLYNSAVIGFPTQFLLQDDETEANFTNQDMRLKHVTLVVPSFEPNTEDVGVGSEGATLSTVENEFNTSSYNNNILTATNTSPFGSGYLPDVIGLSEDAWDLPEPGDSDNTITACPQSDSPLVASNAADFSDLDSWFMDVDFRGAFAEDGDSFNDNWDLNSGWISYVPGDNNYGD